MSVPSSTVSPKSQTEQQQSTLNNKGAEVKTEIRVTPAATATATALTKTSSETKLLNPKENKNDGVLETKIPDAASPKPISDNKLSVTIGGKIDGSRPTTGTNQSITTAMQRNNNVKQPISVPRLDDLLLKALAENYHVYPAFDRIPAEYLDNVIALIDPSRIKFTTAAKYITHEKFWKRLCRERWPICELPLHGQSWKRMYVERHLQSLIESYFPSKEKQNLNKLTKEIEAAKPFIYTLSLSQLPSHLELHELLDDLPNLCTLNVKYGVKHVGMDFDKGQFGMRLSDDMSIAKLLSKTRVLNRLSLTESLLNDESIHILTSGLVKNDTITCLDFSHNKISDTGVKRLTTWINTNKNCVLTSLNLSDNNIQCEGAAALADCLSKNRVLRELFLKLNPLGDEGGKSLFKQIERNSTLTSMDLSATDLKRESGKQLLSLLAQNSTLTKLDLSIGLQGGDSLREAIERNGSLIELDIRKNQLSGEVFQGIETLLSKRFAENKRTKRKKYQEGWDEAM